MFVLRLNDMRSPQIEITETVCWAESREELERFLEAESVAAYTEPRGDRLHWGKTFRKGGPLEWFNKPFKSFRQGIVEVPDIEQAMIEFEARVAQEIEQMRRAHLQRLREIPTVEEFRGQP